MTQHTRELPNSPMAAPEVVHGSHPFGGLDAQKMRKKSRKENFRREEWLLCLER
jgi:hypothetical protein